MPFSNKRFDDFAGARYKMNMVKNKVLDFQNSQADNTLLFFDSPHSGQDYPADFNYICDKLALRRAEDNYVDELYARLANKGFPFLRALFPRSYIDVNRKLYKGDDLNPRLFRTKCLSYNAEKIYAKTPDLKTIFNRIQNYYEPYHQTLGDALNQIHKKQGGYVYLNCHSMLSETKNGHVRPYQVILSNREGATCDDRLLEVLKACFERKGYTVGLNIFGFRGGHLVSKFSNPAENKHAIQIEIVRKIYMNEKTLEKKDSFTKVAEDLEAIFADFNSRICSSGHIPKGKPPKR